VRPGLADRLRRRLVLPGRGRLSQMRRDPGRGQLQHDVPPPGTPLNRERRHRGRRTGPARPAGARVGGRNRRRVLPPPRVRATLAILSEPGSVQTMRSLAACSPARRWRELCETLGRAIRPELTESDPPGKRPMQAVARCASTAGRTDLFTGRQRSGCPWPSARVASGRGPAAGTSHR
jgi:hypothetical protein